MYYVYILYFKKSNSFYKDLTNDLDRRLLEHSNGENKFIKRYLLFTLIPVEICSNRQIARETEKFYKSGFGREIPREILEEIN